MINNDYIGTILPNLYIDKIIISDDDSQLYNNIEIKYSFIEILSDDIFSWSDIPKEALENIKISFRCFINEDPYYVDKFKVMERNDRGVLKTKLKDFTDISIYEAFFQKNNNSSIKLLEDSIYDLVINSRVNPTDNLNNEQAASLKELLQATNGNLLKQYSSNLISKNPFIKADMEYVPYKTKFLIPKNLNLKNVDILITTYYDFNDSRMPDIVNKPVHLKLFREDFADSIQDNNEQKKIHFINEFNYRDGLKYYGPVVYEDIKGTTSTFEPINSGFDSPTQNISFTTFDEIVPFDEGSYYFNESTEKKQLVEKYIDFTRVIDERLKKLPILLQLSEPPEFRKYENYFSKTFIGFETFLGIADKLDKNKTFFVQDDPKKDDDVYGYPNFENSPNELIYLNDRSNLQPINSQENNNPNNINIFEPNTSSPLNGFNGLTSNDNFFNPIRGGANVTNTSQDPLNPIYGGDQGSPINVIKIYRFFDYKRCIIENSLFPFIFINNGSTGKILFDQEIKKYDRKITERFLFGEKSLEDVKFTKYVLKKNSTSQYEEYFKINGIRINLVNDNENPKNNFIKFSHSENLLQSLDLFQNKNFRSYYNLSFNINDPSEFFAINLYFNLLYSINYLKYVDLMISEYKKSVLLSKDVDYTKNDPIRPIINKPLVDSCNHILDSLACLGYDIDKPIMDSYGYSLKTIINLYQSTFLYPDLTFSDYQSGVIRNLLDLIDFLRKKFEDKIPNLKRVDSTGDKNDILRPVLYKKISINQKFTFNQINNLSNSLTLLPTWELSSEGYLSYKYAIFLSKDRDLKENKTFFKIPYIPKKLRGIFDKKLKDLTYEERWLIYHFARTYFVMLKDYHSSLGFEYIMHLFKTDYWTDEEIANGENDYFLKFTGEPGMQQTTFVLDDQIMSEILYNFNNIKGIRKFNKISDLINTFYLNVTLEDNVYVGFEKNELGILDMNKPKKLPIESIKTSKLIPILVEKTVEIEKFQKSKEQYFQIYPYDGVR